MSINLLFFIGERETFTLKERSKFDYPRKRMKTNSPQKISPKKKTHKEKFLDDVKLCAEQQYRQAYRDLKLRQRVERVEEIGKKIVSACIDKKKVREGGLDYIVSDDNLRTDVQTFLCELRLRLEKELKCNFKLDESVTPSPEEIVEEENVEPTTSGVEECRYFKREDYFGSDNMFHVATKLLGKLTMTGYNEIRKNIIEEYRIPSIWLPSFAKLTANCPKVLGFDVTPTLNTLVTNPPLTGLELARRPNLFRIWKMQVYFLTIQI